MLVVTRQAAFYTLSLGELVAVTYMQTPQLMSIYSVLCTAINQYEVVSCRDFKSALINNTRKSHHPNSVSSLYACPQAH
jgi:hypothetical protein